METQRALQKDLIPSTEEIMAWITEIFNRGIRRPGYPADIWVETWIKKKFESYGLDSIKLDPIPISKWTAKNAKLKVWVKDFPENAMQVPCFPLPYSTPIKGLEAELSIFSRDIDLTGKIALLELNLIDLPTTFLKTLTHRFYDPKNEFDTLNQLMPFSVDFQNVMSSTMKAKPSGFIGILSNYPWETQDYYVPYDAVKRKLPGVYVSPKNGKKILELMKDEPVMARLSYEANITDAISHHISGTLEGSSEEWILISSHHDGPWSSAVEDASGIALVLAQANYWSKIPKSQRPFNMMFLLNGAHMAGGGVKIFVERNKTFLDKVVVAIALEHVARDIKSENGELIILDDPVVRWWFTSRIELLENIVEDAIIKEDIYRSVIMPPDGFPPDSENPPTDAGPYHLAEVPIVSLLAAPPYLFDPADKIDKIHVKSLVPITQAVIRIIDSLENQTATGLRNQVRKKEKDSKQLRRYVEKLRKNQD